MEKLTNEHVLHWTNEKHDLYTDERLMTFGYFRDFFNRVDWFYCRYPDGTYAQLSSNIYVAIDEFNKKAPPGEVVEVGE